MSEISERYHQVRQQIQAAAEQCGRSPDGIELLAVSKRKPIEDIEAMYALGQKAFGENYLQEALLKIKAIQHNDVIWHFIGHIQSNKTKEIALHFDWVHGIEKAKHASQLDKHRAILGKPLQACIQVNITGEASKGGVTIEQLPELANHISQLENIQLRGLMTMPDPNTPAEEQKAVFTRLRECKEQLQQQGLTLDTLSMGMSGDMNDAICEGSTMIRIGTALFGKRE